MTLETGGGKSLVPVASIESRILFIRGTRVMLDVDLAELFGVRTKALNQSVTRNAQRFPSDFMFRLTGREKWEVVTNCDHLARLRFSPHHPRAFTEHGAVMLATVLNSPAAVRMGIYVVRAFVRLRAAASTHHQLAEKLGELERVVGTHDQSIRAVFLALKQLMQPPYRKKRRIGFLARDRNARRYPAEPA